MSCSFTARLASGAGGFTTAPTFSTNVEPRPGLFFQANDASGNPKRWMVAWVESVGTGIEVGCEGPLPPPPPPTHPTT